MTMTLLFRVESKRRLVEWMAELLIIVILTNDNIAVHI